MATITFYVNTHHAEVFHTYCGGYLSLSELSEVYFMQNNKTTWKLVVLPSTRVLTYKIYGLVYQIMDNV